MFRTRRTRAAAAAAVTAVILAAGALAAGSAGAAPAPARTAATAAKPADILPLLGETRAAPRAAARAPAAAAPAPVTSPLSPSACQAAYGTPCYDATALRKIYGTAGMTDQGQGADLALIMPYHNDVIVHDLDTYARRSGLPRPDLHVTEYGRPVTASAGNPDQNLAETEETLDLEMYDAMAPRARIDLIETQQDFSLAPGGFTYATDILRQLPSILGRQPDAVSFSLGSSEANYAEQAGSTAAGNSVIRQQAAGIAAAVAHGTTVTASTGDTGPASYNLAGTKIFGPAAYFPATDPLVTAASGTEVQADDTGLRTQQDTVWADGGDGAATGGGLSSVFAAPVWQAPYTALTGGHRGAGDIAMDGATETPVEIYSSKYDPFPDQAPGWLRVAGTSASSPMFTGIVALAAALAGHPLGNVNPRLYAMARHAAADGIEAVTSGCNTDDGIQGYCAGNGPWSMPDGTGTVGNATRFVPALAGTAPR